VTRPKGHRWRIIRQQILDANHVCALQLEGCTRYATAVDHIIPLSRGGDPTHPTNLQPVCRNCNSVKGNRDDLQPTNRTTRDW
jgi:5-methylcytosine-specific restriction endonuclease McrA